MHSFAALLQHQLLWVTSFLIRAAAVFAALYPLMTNMLH
ncbi:hypothetical protein FORC066_0691 [Yersinia enterocolitica]|nr:hypothetical protein FORC066_0691 [Yersinia enterocolitica]